jgi:hypothetical protein
MPSRTPTPFSSSINPHCIYNSTSLCIFPPHSTAVLAIDLGARPSTTPSRAARVSTCDSAEAWRSADTREAAGWSVLGVSADFFFHSTPITPSTLHPLQPVLPEGFHPLASPLLSCFTPFHFTPIPKAFLSTWFIPLPLRPLSSPYGTPARPLRLFTFFTFTNHKDSAIPARTTLPLLTHLLLPYLHRLSLMVLITVLLCSLLPLPVSHTASGHEQGRASTDQGGSKRAR